MKILCPFHKEDTPSCHVYPDGIAYCFGCARAFRAKKAGVSELPEAREPEDPAPMLEYIGALPTKQIRGLELPFDERGYYLVFPGGNYYKLRLWEGKTRYIGPRGQKPPLFIAGLGSSEWGLFVEGEINALSLAQACPELTVVSPGAASQFNQEACKKYLQSVVSCSKILVIADADAPGCKAVIEAVAAFAGQAREVKWLTMEKDANEVLQAEGKAALRAQISGRVEGVLDDSPL
jgi:hypothetical protein